ncbi:MAG: TerB family tellurite resistance protein [Muribaculaceae bacterium]|nr:TerB family tellurite resistance protein [Muribaculaceae bacterium]
MELDKSKHLQSQFLALYCMVVADGVIDVKELEALYKVGEQQYNLTVDEINKAVLNNGTSFVVPENFDSKIKFLYNLATIAWADGILEESEIQLMHKYIVRIGFLEENREEIANFIFDCVKQGKTIDETVLLAKS